MLTPKLLLSVASYSLVMIITGCSSSTNIPSKEIDKMDNKVSEYKQPDDQKPKEQYKPLEIATKANTDSKASTNKLEFFTKDEINDLSKAFSHDSCDMTAFNQQTKKYHFNNTYGNPYVDGQDDIEELSDDGKCLLIQQADIEASYITFFNDDKGNIHVGADLKKVDLESNHTNRLSFNIDHSKYPSCNLYQQESPFIIVFIKDPLGNIERLIAKNEYEVFDCYEEAMGNIRTVENHPVKLDKKGYGKYRYSTYQTDESKGAGVGEDYTINVKVYFDNDNTDSSISEYVVRQSQTNDPLSFSIKSYIDGVSKQEANLGFKTNNLGISSFNMKVEDKTALINFISSDLDIRDSEQILNFDYNIHQTAEQFDEVDDVKICINHIYNYQMAFLANEEAVDCPFKF